MSVPEIFHTGQGLSADLFFPECADRIGTGFFAGWRTGGICLASPGVKIPGAKTNKFVSYSIATVAGIVLSVCSCTAIPLFAGIRKRGAGLGRRSLFYALAPALDILPIIYTFRLIGNQFGWARLIGGVGLSVILGLLLALIFREEKSGINADLTAGLPQNEENKPWWMQVIFFRVINSHDDSD